jgi:hypothetical protein
MRRNSTLGIGLLIAPLTIGVGMLTACSDQQDSEIARVRQPLEVRCADEVDSLPEMSWVCPDELTVECSDPEGTDVALIYGTPPEAQQCSDFEVSVAPKGPFAVGTHEIEITSSADGGTSLCETTLTVVDTTPPELSPKHVELWPPNHKWHTITASDCFEIHDACDATVEATLLWVSSDEASDDTGDGNTEPDMQFLGCDSVQLRAERQGSGDGRVYRLGWQFEDDEANTVEKTCQVIVPHDQGHAVAPPDAGAVVELHNRAACAPAADAGGD